MSDINYRELFNSLTGNTEEVEDDLGVDFFNDLINNLNININPQTMKDFIDMGITISKYQDFKVKYKDIVQGNYYKILNFKKCHPEIPLAVLHNLSEMGFFYDSDKDVLYKEYPPEDSDFLTIIASGDVFDISDKFE